jgi:branched-chain amino acid transport system substrate-binding protein
MEPAPGSGPGASPAVVASVGTYSGPAGTILLPILQGAQLWVKYVNDRGGLNHHPVKLLAYDDGGDPSRHRAQVQEAIERQHAIAFLANAEGFTGQSSVSYITSKRVPVIPDVGGGHYYDSPMYFPASPSGLIFVYATLEALAHRWVPAGKTKLGLAYCVEAPSCTESQKLYQRWARPLGLDLVYQTGVSLAQPDYTAECLAARSAGAEILSTFVDQSSVTRFAANCARQGYHPIFSVPGTVMDLAWKDNPHLDNFTSGSGTFLWFQSGTPATDEFQHALRTYGSKVPRTVAVTNGWVAGKLLERAAAALPEPPTSEALLQGLWAIKNDDLGGLTYPLTFVENQPAKPVACWFNLVIEKRSWVSPDGFRLNCSANRLNSRGLPPSG